VAALCVAKRIVGWLAILTWIGWFCTLIGLIAVEATRDLNHQSIFGSGFGTRDLPWPDRNAAIDRLQRAGGLSGAKVEKILEEYVVEQRVRPKGSPESPAWKARPDDWYQNALAAVILDPNGRAIAAYPPQLRGIENPFPYPLRDIPAENGYTPYQPHPSDFQKTGVLAVPAVTPPEAPAPEEVKSKLSGWYTTMERLMSRQVAGHNWVLLDPIKDPKGEPIGALVTATNGYLKVNVTPTIASLRNLPSEAAWVAMMVTTLLAAYLLTAAWVVLDARWRGTNGFVWALVYMVTTILGLALYLIARPADPLLCPRCSKRLGKRHAACPYCGLEIRSRCPACGAYLLHEWRYCPQCNIDVWDVPTPAPAPIPAPVAERRGDLIRPTPRSQPAVQTILVQVYDAETGEAVRNAKVTCKGPTEQAVLLTNSDGQAEANDANPGIYKMLIRATGYKEQQRMEELKPGDSLRLTVRIEPLPGRVSGNVYDALSKLPLSPARIRSDSSRVRIDATTDELGRFETAEAPAGPCILTCEFKDYMTGREQCVIPPGGEALVDFALQPEEGKGIPVATGAGEDAAAEKDAASA
jgi:hypothetical protein